MKTRGIVPFILTKHTFCRAMAGLISALFLTGLDVGHAAQPSFDGGIVIKNGDAEYVEGGTWEAGKNKGDYYRYGMDHSEARKTTVPGSWAQWTPQLPAPGTYRVYLWHIVWGAHGPVTIEIQHNGKTETLKRNNGDGHSGWNSLPSITSTKIDVDLRRADGSDIGVAWAEQGHFEQGRWVKDGPGAVETTGQSLKLRFPKENLKYGQIRLKVIL